MISKTICTATIFLIIVGSIVGSCLIQVPHTNWWDPDVHRYFAGKSEALVSWIIENAVIPLFFFGLSGVLIFALWKSAEFICMRLRGTQDPEVK